MLFFQTILATSCSANNELCILATSTNKDITLSLEFKPFDSQNYLAFGYGGEGMTDQNIVVIQQDGSTYSADSYHSTTTAMPKKVVNIWKVSSSGDSKLVIKGSDLKFPINGGEMVYASGPVMNGKIQKHTAQGKFQIEATSTESTSYASPDAAVTSYSTPNSNIGYSNPASVSSVDSSQCPCPCACASKPVKTEFKKLRNIGNNYQQPPPPTPSPTPVTKVAANPIIPTQKPISVATKSAPIPVTSRTAPSPVVTKSAPLPVASKSAPIPKNYAQNIPHGIAPEMQKGPYPNPEQFGGYQEMPEPGPQFIPEVMPEQQFEEFRIFHVQQEMPMPRGPMPGPLPMHQRPMPRGPMPEPQPIRNTNQYSNPKPRAPRVASVPMPSQPLKPRRKPKQYSSNISQNVDNVASTPRLPLKKTPNDKYPSIQQMPVSFSPSEVAATSTPTPLKEYPAPISHIPANNIARAIPTPEQHKEERKGYLVQATEAGYLVQATETIPVSTTPALNSALPVAASNSISPSPEPTPESEPEPSGVYSNSNPIAPTTAPEPSASAQQTATHSYAGYVEQVPSSGSATSPACTSASDLKLESLPTTATISQGDSVKASYTQQLSPMHENITKFHGNATQTSNKTNTPLAKSAKQTQVSHPIAAKEDVGYDGEAVSEETESEIFDQGYTSSASETNLMIVLICYIAII